MNNLTIRQKTVDVAQSALAFTQNANVVTSDNPKSNNPQNGKHREGGEHTGLSYCWGE